MTATGWPDNLKADEKNEKSGGLIGTMGDIVTESQQTVAEAITAEKGLMRNPEAETDAYFPQVPLPRH